MAIEGTQQIVVSITIGVPPGVDPKQVGASLSQGGISVAVGLLQYVKNVNVDVQDVKSPLGIV